MGGRTWPTPTDGTADTTTNHNNSIRKPTNPVASLWYSFMRSLKQVLNDFQLAVRASLTPIVFHKLSKWPAWGGRVTTKQVRPSVSRQASKTVGWFLVAWSKVFTTTTSTKA